MPSTNLKVPYYLKTESNFTNYNQVPTVVCIPDEQKNPLVKSLKALRYDVLLGGDQENSGESDDVLLFDVHDHHSVHFIATDQGEFIGGARLVMPLKGKSLPVVRSYPDALSSDIDHVKIAQIDMYVTVKSFRRRKDDQIEGVSSDKSRLEMLEQGRMSRNYLLLLTILKNMFVVAKKSGVEYLVYQMSVPMQKTFDALSITYKKLCDVDVADNQTTPCLIVIDEVLLYFTKSKTPMSMWFLTR